MVWLVCITISAVVIATIGLLLWERDRRKYQLELDTLHRQVLEAERLLRLRCDLANEIAHEIKNPITAILCSAETLDLLVGPQLEDVHRRSLQYIREYSSNLLRLISDFLDVSVAESGSLKAVPEVVPVVSIINSVLGLLDANAIRKQIKLRSSIKNETLSCFIDPTHFKQLIFNLVHNAIKFTPNGGSVDIIAEEDLSQRHIKIAVRDNGMGIAEEDLSKLFNPYARYEHQSSDSVTDRAVGEGVGLGLALCKSFCESAGGTVSVESVQGIGTCFEVRLPMVEQSQEDAVKMGGEAALDLVKIGQVPLTGQHYLLVDDDEGARESVAQLIQAWGGMVDQVNDAAAALEALRLKRYSAVVVDAMAGQGSSREAVRLLQEEKQCSDTAIIVALDAGHTAMDSPPTGADLCVAKPLCSQSLLPSLIRRVRV